MKKTFHGWHNPLPDYQLIASADDQSFLIFGARETALPLPPHQGAFGVQRKHHIHEGVDLYCAQGTAVHAVEDGVIVNILPFTGEKAGSPWWHNTDALMIEGKTGVIVYGEIKPNPHLSLGQSITAGDVLGHVIPVLKQDKGRPHSMLHLELHCHGTRDVYEWSSPESPPPSLKDPTAWLLPLAQKNF